MGKTRLTGREIQKIIDDYDLGTLRHFFHFTKGLEHTNVLIKTSKGKFVLRLYERGRTEKFVKFELDLLRKLHYGGFPTSYSLTTKKHKKLSTFKGKPLLVFNYIRGRHIYRPSTDQIKQVGKALAKLHLITRGFKPKGSSLRWNASVEKIKKLSLNSIQKAKQRGTWNSTKISTTLKEEFKLFTFPHTLPQGTLHADLFKDNVKFFKEKLEGILDFDDAYYGNLIDDLSTAIFGWCFPYNKLNLTLTQAMIQSYQQRRKITPAEAAYLYLSLKFIALKFTIYVMNRRGKQNKALHDFFQRFLSLQKVSMHKFNKTVFV